MSLKSIQSDPKRLLPWHKLDSTRPTIGVLHPCYGASHTIYGLGLEDYTFRKVPSISLNRFDNSTTFFNFTPFLLDTRLPLVHSWNAIPVNRDFIVSYELELPRYLGNPTDFQIKFGLNILASDRCKGLFPLSDFAYRFSEQRFKTFGFEQLIDKMSVFRGGIPELEVDSYWSKEAIQPARSGGFSGVVIGTDLFRKGGMHMIEAFRRLREEEGLDVTLTLIGLFEENCYAFDPFTPNAQEWMDKAKSYEWIKFQEPIPFGKVFPTLLAHDICLAVSVDESLGWLPIEAAMVGRPVLAARVCAFPEFVQHKETGWLIDIPLNADGRWVGINKNKDEKKVLISELNDTIINGVVNCIRTVYKDKSILKEWGSEGRNRIKSLYGMEKARNQLAKIYQERISQR